MPGLRLRLLRRIRLLLRSLYRHCPWSQSGPVAVRWPLGGGHSRRCTSSESTRGDYRSPESSDVTDFYRRSIDGPDQTAARLLHRQTLCRASNTCAMSFGSPTADPRRCPAGSAHLHTDAPPPALRAQARNPQRTREHHLRQTWMAWSSRKTGTSRSRSATGPRHGPSPSPPSSRNPRRTSPAPGRPCRQQLVDRGHGRAISYRRVVNRAILSRKGRVRLQPDPKLGRALLRPRHRVT
jgi:hypothetical protein